MHHRFVGQLIELYQKMDEEYEKTASSYGFRCKGCKDNCCMTLFYHHTYVEYSYLHKGFQTLDSAMRKEVRKKSANFRKTYRKYLENPEKTHNASFRMMCPLNHDGMCILYTYRPMICRLHGIPHEHRMTDGIVKKGEGCAFFHSLCSDKPYVLFDRTPFYRELANIEMALRQASGLSHKFKMTVQDMIETFLSYENINF